MINYLAIIIIVSLGTSFIMTLLIKWRVIDKMYYEADGLFKKLLECNFCMCFWLSSAIGLLMFIITLSVPYIFIGVFSSVLSKIILDL